MQNKVGIVIVNYNGAEYIEDCMDSLQQQTYKNLEILFWDNNSEDDSVNIIQQRYPQVQIIACRDNYGFSKANNLAVKQILKRGAEYVLLLNADTVAAPYLIERLLEKADSNTVTTARIYTDGNQKWYAGGELQFDIGDSRHTHIRGCAEAKRVTFISGCCMMIHKDIIKKYGLFDIKYYLYYEDTDLCMRWYLNGINMYYITNAELWHKVGGSSGGIKNPLKQYYMVRNRLYFVDKYKKNIETDTWKVLLMLIKENLICSTDNWMLRKATCLGIIDYYKHKMGRMNHKYIYQSDKWRDKPHMKKGWEMLACDPYNGNGNAYIDNMVSILSQYFYVIPFDEKKGSFREIKKCKGIILSWYEDGLNIFKGIRLGVYKLAGVKIIWVFHNRFPHQPKNHFIAWLKMQSMIFLSDIIILHSKNSKYCLQQYSKPAIKKAVYIPHVNYCENYRDTGCNYRKQLGIEDSDFVFLFWGFIEAYKNIELLVQIFNEWNIEDAILLIVGNPKDTQYMERIKKLSEKNKKIILKDRFIPDSKVHTYLNTCDVAVLPYHKESYNNSGAMISAFSCGKTVIIPDIPMAKDMSKLCYTYRYRSEEEHKAALEVAMRKCYILGKDANHRMGAKAREYVKRNNSREKVMEYIEKELELLK
ncbi:MAG: glycosyltransferase [Lachnospiraceae bacterium]|nr:glycosyltransferase [Lachnospiraceae bacterium]